MRIAVAGATGLVGRHVVVAAEEAGHEVVRLARSEGVDLTAPDGLVERLAGVDAVVDVTGGTSTDEQEARTFFTAVAANLGDAAASAGVTRTVLLSIIGLDRMLDYGYYAAKYDHERTTLDHAPEPHILRAAQFLDFPGQVLEWFGDGQSVTVPVMPTQPVAVEEIARVLVQLADGTDTRSMVEIAGPKPELLADLVRQLAESRGEDIRVETVEASPAMTAGGCLPGPDAILAGPDFATWLAAQESAG